jgi:hypothetical protein
MTALTNRTGLLFSDMVKKDWLTLRSLEVFVGLQAEGQSVGVSSTLSGALNQAHLRSVKSVAMISRLADVAMF